MKKIFEILVFFALVLTCSAQTIVTNKIYIGAGSRIYDANGIKFYPNNQGVTAATNIIDWINKSGGTINSDKLSAAGLSATNQFTVFTNLGYIASSVNSNPDGTNLVDFQAYGKLIISLTNDVTLIPTNHALGRATSITFIGGTTNFNVVFPGAWHRYSGSLTNDVVSNKWATASVFYPQSLTGEVSYVQEP